MSITGITGITDITGITGITGITCITCYTWFTCITCITCITWFSDLSKIWRKKVCLTYLLKKKSISASHAKLWIQLFQGTNEKHILWDFPTMKLGEMPGYLLVAYQGVGDRVALEHNGPTLIAHCDAWSLHRDIAAPMDGVIVVIVFNIWGSKVLLQF